MVLNCDFDFFNKRLKTIYSNNIKKLNANGTTVSHRTIGFSEASNQPVISS
jgi:hypothetical protein